MRGNGKSTTRCIVTAPQQQGWPWECRELLNHLLQPAELLFNELKSGGLGGSLLGHDCGPTNAAPPGKSYGRLLRMDKRKRTRLSRLLLVYGLLTLTSNG